MNLLLRYKIIREWIFAVLEKNSGFYKIESDISCKRRPIKSNSDIKWIDLWLLISHRDEYVI